MGDKFPSDPRRELARRQEGALAIVAQQFASEGQFPEALELVRRSEGFNVENLNTLMKVWREAEDEAIRSQAAELFESYLARVPDAKYLAIVQEHALNPSHAALPSSFIEGIRRRRKELDPEWDGVMEPFRAFMRRLYKKPVESIEESDTALTLAAASAEPQSAEAYFKRYLELGGDPENPRYLRIRLNKILRGEDTSGTPEEYLPRLMKRVGAQEFQRWVRSNTKRGLEGYKTEEFARTVLAFYVSSYPLLSDFEWLFITDRALDLSDYELRRICFEYWKARPRDEQAQRLFETLSGQMARGKGPRGSGDFHNPVYDRLETSSAMNADAGMSLSGWVQKVIG